MLTSCPILESLVPQDRDDRDREERDRPVEKPAPQVREDALIVGADQDGCQANLLDMGDPVPTPSPAPAPAAPAAQGWSGLLRASVHAHVRELFHLWSGALLGKVPLRVAAAASGTSPLARRLPPAPMASETL